MRFFSVPNSKKQFNDGVSDSSTDDDDEEDDDKEEGSDDGQETESETAEDKVVPNGIEQAKNKDESSKKKVENIDSKENTDNSKKTAKEPKTLIISDKNEPQHNKLEKKDTSILFAKQNNKEDDDSDDDDDEEESSEGDESGDETSKPNDFTNLSDLRESDKESGDEMDAVDEGEITSFFDLKSTEGDNLKVINKKFLKINWYVELDFFPSFISFLIFICIFTFHK